MSGAPPGDPPRGVAVMSVVRWVLVGLVAIAATTSIVSYLRARRGTPAGQGGHEPAGDARLAATDGGRGAARRSAPLYYCPMHVSVVQDHPGECPICSMTLVPKPDGPAAPVPGGPSPLPGLAEVDLSPDRIQLSGMRTATVAREALGVELRAVGVVVPSERGLAQVSPRFAGWIQQLLVSETGARVRRGQTLALVYSPEVLRAQEELLVARGWSASARDRASTGTAAPSVTAPAAGLDADARRRLELLGVASSEIDEVLRRGKALDAIPVRSPVDGTVVAKAAVAGGAVQPGTVLFEVADLSLVWVTVEIPEQDLGRIHVGQKAHFELTAFPGEAHDGKVQLISPVLDSSARTLRVRIELRNRIDRDGPRLRPGMSGTVRFDAPARSAGAAAPPALVVPAEAVVDTGRARYVFVAKPGGHFEPRPVKVGARAGDRVEVLSGLAEGETVVTTGNFLLDSESRLRAALAGADAKSEGK